MALFEEQVDKYKEKYLKVKHTNKNLQSHLKEVLTIIYIKFS